MMKDRDKGAHALNSTIENVFNRNITRYQELPKEA